MAVAAIYARYSSDNQRDASIEDQVRLCKRTIENKGWIVGEVYSDHAISGASTLRPGYQKMLEDARNERFDHVVSEALDRLSRDQENIAGLYKQLSFANVSLFTVSEGDINELHVGLKGTMNALFLKDLADKTRRGLEGRVRKGKSGGGICYGYDVVRSTNAMGEAERGDRCINPEQAEIVVRIFEEFAANRSPRKIAQELNKESVPGPCGGSWGASTIHGNWRRGTGILNNELYIGRLVWNRQRYVKDPISQKRQARLNPKSEWIIEEVPHLRVVAPELWQQVKERQKKSRNVVKTENKIRPERMRRHRYLLSGLLKCGICGGGFSIINKSHYGCSSARNKGTCDNRLTIKRTSLEQRILDGLKDQLMHPDCVREFVKEFHKEINTLEAEQGSERRNIMRCLSKVDRELANIVQAIKNGVPALSLKDELYSLEERKQDLEKSLNRIPSNVVRLHPNMAELYAEKVANLTGALDKTDSHNEVSDAIRALISEIRLVPVDGQITVELYGELSALFGLANDSTQRKDTEVQVTLVAGVGFEPTTFRL